ncbi:winged helix-turn-helix transcriptional regulator [Streptomyces sp. NPDC055078]
MPRTHAIPDAPYGAGTPTREMIDLLANRWTIHIVRTLSPGPLRFTELRDASGISAQVLIRTLRTLEHDGLVAREVFAEVPPRVEYRLTELGTTLCPVVHAIRDWAEQHAHEVIAARTRAGDG